MKKLLPILFLLLSLEGFSQRGPYLDSLWKVWSDVHQPDTTRLKAMYDFAWDGFLYTQPDSSYYFSNVMLEYAKKNGLKKFEAQALNLQFSYYFGKGEITKAEIVNNQGLALRTELGDKLGMAVACTNTGILAQVQGNYPRAIDFYTQSLKYNEEIDNKSGIGTSLHNIGHVYQDQGDHLKALDYYQRSLKIREEIHELRTVAESEINMAGSLLDLHEYEKAMHVLERAAVICREMDLKPALAAALGNMGMVYDAKGEGDKAVDYYTQSLAIQEEIGDNIGRATSLVNIGRILLHHNEDEKAIGFFRQALQISRETGGDANGIKQASQSLSEAYKKTGRYKDALAMHELYMTMWDSINGEESKKELVRQEFKYNYEKKAAADSVREADEKKVVAAQFAQEQTTRYALYIGLAFLMIFGIFMFNRFRISQKQKAIIEQQKLLVESKQQEVMDSIHYAGRIQKSLLPNEKYIDKHLKRLQKK
ncbi:MAG: tetratricopeptide repeat protein [Bacteroidia bacterium]